MYSLSCGDKLSLCHLCILMSLHVTSVCLQAGKSSIYFWPFFGVSLYLFEETGTPLESQVFSEHNVICPTL